ncbi:hypothetical protein ACLOJK_014367 [Asimina triloba]
MGDVSDHSKAMRGRKSCRGKGVAKEKKVPRRGMGVARLERMRLLEQKGTFFMMEDGEDIIIEKTARTTTTAPLLSCFVPLPYLLQRFPDQVGVEREALELAWNRGIGQWHFLESSIVTTTPSSLLLAPTNMDRTHTIPRDFSYTSTSTDGNNMINLGYTAPSFAATTKLQGNRIQTSDWSDTCLDLSLSTAHHISQERRNLFQENQKVTYFWNYTRHDRKREAEQRECRGPDSDRSCGKRKRKRGAGAGAGAAVVREHLSFTTEGNRNPPLLPSPLLGLLLRFNSPSVSRPDSYLTLESCLYSPFLFSQSSLFFDDVTSISASMLQWMTHLPILVRLTSPDSAKTASIHQRLDSSINQL